MLSKKKLDALRLEGPPTPPSKLRRMTARDTGGGMSDSCRCVCECAWDGWRGRKN